MIIGLMVIFKTLMYISYAHIRLTTVFSLRLHSTHTLQLNVLLSLTINKI